MEGYDLKPMDSYHNHELSRLYFEACYLLKKESGFLASSRKSLKQLDQDAIIKFLTGVSVKSDSLETFLDSGLNDNSSSIINFMLNFRDLFIYGSDPKTHREISAYVRFLPAEERSEIALDKAWNIVRPVLYSSLSKNEYRMHKYGKIVKSLIITHSEINFSELDPKLPAYIKKGGSHEKVELINAHSGKMKALIGWDFDKNKWKPYFTDWFYTFWYRRHMEGTTNVAYRILVEIDKHYEKG